MNRRTKLAAGVVLASAMLSTLIWRDTLDTPGEIPFPRTSRRHQGIVINRSAEGLIAQQFAEAHGVYATRGYDIYLLGPASERFRHLGRLPVPLGSAWLGNSSTLRHVLNRQEVTELMRLRSGTLVAFAGGYLFRGETQGGAPSWVITGRLEHFGIREGRGIMPQGHAENDSGVVYWGEYWDNKARQPVRVWRSANDGRSWEVAHEFPARAARHVHAVQWDPQSRSTWITTGDLDAECMIGYFDAIGTLVEIGRGSQKWRAVSLVFSEDAVFWGTDGRSKEHPENVVWRWDRRTREAQQLTVIGSSAFYSARAARTAVITTDASRGTAELWATDDLVHWASRASFSRARDDHFGTVRVVAGADDSLFLSLNNLEYCNGCLLEAAVARE